jgi:hypothetical protein
MPMFTVRLTTADAAVRSTTSHAITAFCRNNVIRGRFKFYILDIFLICSSVLSPVARHAIIFGQKDLFC